jgi:hypothetical protein
MDFVRVEAGAIDYLLKPISESRLEKAIARVKTMLNRPVAVANQVAQIASVSTPSNPRAEESWGGPERTISSWMQMKFWPSKLANVHEPRPRPDAAVRRGRSGGGTRPERRPQERRLSRGRSGYPAISRRRLKCWNRRTMPVT